MAQVEMKDAEQVGQQQLYSLLVYIIRGWRSTEEFMGEFGSVLNSTIRAGEDIRHVVPSRRFSSVLHLILTV